MLREKVCFTGWLCRFGCCGGVNGVFIMISVSAVIANTLRRQITGRQLSEAADRPGQRARAASYRYLAPTAIDICPQMHNVSIWYEVKYYFLSS